MAGFIPAIHVFRAKTWMRGTSPRMTQRIPGMADTAPAG
jgi:hypothetical protein